jgi:FkbM family methyltransferase
MSMPESSSTGAVSQFVLDAVRLYCRQFPIRFGKGTLQQIALRCTSARRVVAETLDGRRLTLRFPEDRGWEEAYFSGEFETGTTTIASALVQPSDTVLDIGANIGWFTTLFASRLRGGGRCIAFEPNPETFRLLEDNCTMNGSGPAVVLRNIGLADAPGTLQLHMFQGLGSGRASLSNLGRKDATTVDIPVITLDDALAEINVGAVDLIKIDVEGAEMKVLRGAKALLAQDPAPIWIVEMNRETAANSGYEPSEMLRLITARPGWRLYRIELGWGRILPMTRIDDWADGDNVLCIPPGSPRASLVEP